MVEIKNIKAVYRGNQNNNDHKNCLLIVFKDGSGLMIETGYENGLSKQEVLDVIRSY